MSRRLKLFILLIAIASGSIVYAGAGADGESVSLTVGRSTVVDTGMPIARVSLTSADVADALVTSPSELLINGKTPGTISMFVWNRAGGIKRYEINVQRDLARLTSQLKELFPNEKIEARANGRAIVLSGAVSNKDVIDRAVSLAGGYVDKKEDVITLLQLAEGAPSNQVLLRVRFAEVSRSALTELGVNFFTSPAGYKDVQGRVTTQQFPAPVFDSSNGQPKLVFSDYLNFFLWDFKHDLGGVVKALQTRGLFQSLAEPNLVAESGKEASFLAGGELPIPVAQPGGAGVAVTIMWKEFGIRLNFTPQVNGDRVHLKVRPEVSTLDFTNAITLQGFRIPALSTRRTETELELVNGQTFAIAGLMNNQMNKSLQKIPGIGDIPILGLLFRSEAAQKDRTELVVMITPQILRNNSPGVTNELPRTPESFLPPLDPRRTKELPPPAFPPVPPRSGAANNAAPMPVPAAAANQDPAAAAAKMQALTPSSTRPIVNGDAQPASTETPASTVSRPLTPQEQKMMQRARQQEMEARKAQEAAAKKLREKLSGDQARKDAEATRQATAAARRQAEADKAAQAVAAKRNAEIAKKQAEIDKKRQKEIAEAEAKLKAAQAAYEAELAKAKKKDQDQ
jgi:pilus assembly protein CpaC